MILYLYIRDGGRTMEEKKETTYSRLSDEQKRKKMLKNQEYIKRDYQIVTVKIKKTDFEKISDYMEACGAKSNNSFFKEAVKYAIENDFKGVND